MPGKNIGTSFLSSRVGKGRGGAECDLSEVDGSLKFILFFFTVKKSRAQRLAGPLQAPSQWLATRFSSSRRRRSASLLPRLLAVSSRC